jgi:L-threonate 2-dehydrogenase
MSKVLLIGLGAMGFGMGRSLLRAGHAVCGIDIDAAVTARFVEVGGLASSRAEAAATADIAILVVVNARQTEDVLFGEGGIADRLPRGAVVVSCATFVPEHAVDFESRLQARNVLYLDAPISGGSARAAEGKLSIMASGHPDAFAMARPALDAMAETVFELGDRAGAGSAMKIVNQLLAGIHVLATAEAMCFGIGQGIDPHRMIDVISRSAGSSWMFQNRGPYIADGDYRPHSAVDIFVKDLGIVRQIAAASGISVKLADAAFERFQAAREAGFGSAGDVAVAKIYAEEGGIVLPEAARGRTGGR